MVVGVEAFFKRKFKVPLSRIFKANNIVIQKLPFGIGIGFIR